jgi:lysozyme
MNFACPDPDELFCLDWEDNPSGTRMSRDQAEEWITKVEQMLNRPGECVIYGGNTLKELLDESDDFFGARRLWLCQYGSTPGLPDCWDDYWLWQYTDGQVGPTPHTIDGIGPCDINSYADSKDALIAEWASGLPMPAPKPEPEVASIHLNIQTTGHCEVSIAVNGEVIYGDADSASSSE